MATWDDVGGTFSGGLSGAAGLGALSTMSTFTAGGALAGLAPMLGPAGLVIGGLVGFFGSQAKRRKQNRQIDKHNKKIKKQRTLVKGEQKKVGEKMAGIGTYFDALEEHQADLVKDETETALDSFVASTVGQIENLEDVGAKTGLEASSIDKKISTVKDLTARKSEDIKNIGRKQEEALTLSIAGQRAQTEQASRDMWHDLAQQYEMLGEEFMDRV